MRYLMFVVADPALAAEADPDADDLTIDEWLAEVEGKRVIGDRLERPDAAKTVWVSKGEVLVTDGPFTESKEWIAGFDVIDADSLEDAIRIASRHPQANGGKLELRPFWTDED
ncbi:YciI family protein [Nocardioides sp. LS1]|uniref:YciI family protein n=1 Tax=Nocardioides sp. LS1 TaxID=1027620 RepID=UPI000F624AC6|nr:YciI family protein [Nocardioides sp. LS1]GCD90260.1 transcription initiation protein [Nocardioides sp. LS1]